MKFVLKDIVGINDDLVIFLMLLISFLRFGMMLLRFEMR